MRKLYKMLGAAKYQNFIAMAQVAIVNGDLSRLAKLMMKYNINISVDDLLKQIA